MRPPKFLQEALRKASKSAQETFQMGFTRPEGRRTPTLPGHWEGLGGRFWGVAPMRSGHRAPEGEAAAVSAKRDVEREARISGKKPPPEPQVLPPPSGELPLPPAPVFYEQNCRGS